MGCCLHSDFGRQRQHTAATSKHGGDYDTTTYGGSARVRRVELKIFAAGGQHPAATSKTPYPVRTRCLMHIAEPPRRAGGSGYTMYRNPASGFKLRSFCRRRPTPRYDLKGTYTLE
ncbi:hypothetical protein C8R43DRAFT_1241128 [Mycena crocata]|nr:hypothetical protein C8R43DRAFT_1241128 [Mycena crocata]